jgi:hypothetical protein
VARIFGGSQRRKRYAVEVEGSRADSFDIPGAEVCQSWENGDGSTTFILESSQDLRPAAEKMQGVRRVSLM